MQSNILETANAAIASLNLAPLSVAESAAIETLVAERLPSILASTPASAQAFARHIVVCDSVLEMRGLGCMVQEVIANAQALAEHGAAVTLEQIRAGRYPAPQPEDLEMVAGGMRAKIVNLLSTGGLTLDQLRDQITLYATRAVRVAFGDPPALN